MLKSLILIASLLLSFNTAFAESDTSKIILSEWAQLRLHVETLKADGDIGGYMDFKNYEHATLLWRISDNKNDNEVIRFYNERADGSSFAITYHKSNIIIDGRTVIRRFIGTEPAGWINHTVDYNTGEYLQRQGYFPKLLPEEYKLMESWNITPIKE